MTAQPSLVYITELSGWLKQILGKGNAMTNILSFIDLL